MRFWHVPQTPEHMPSQAGSDLEPSTGIFGWHADSPNGDLVVDVENATMDIERTLTGAGIC